MKASRQILVIDDDEAIREFVSLALSDEGYEVLGAANGAVALELLSTTRPHLILLDTRMPIMNGLEFADTYRRTPGPHAPIVVLTAALDADTLAREIAAEALLPKPFDLDDLVRVVGQIAGEP